MKLLVYRIFALFIVIGLTVSVTAHGQAYPTKPIRIITSEAGGGTDFVSRLVAQSASGPLGQQVIVENRPSAVTGESVAKAAPDGYTLLLNGTGFWLAPLLTKANYDAVKDFAPISMLTSSPNLIVVHPSLPAKTMKEFIALAKAHPGALNYGSSAPGTPSHLGAEMLKSLAHIDLVRISYRGNGPAINALIAGEVQLMVVSAGGITTQVNSGRLRALAVTSAKPSALVPNLPTVASTVPGYDAASTYGLLAPAGTPAAIVNRWNQEVVRVLNIPENKERLFKAGVEVVGSSPEQLGATIKSDLSVWGKVIKDAGIRAD